MNAVFFFPTKGTDAIGTQWHSHRYTETPAAPLPLPKKSEPHCSHLTEDTNSYMHSLVTISHVSLSSLHQHPHSPPCALCCPFRHFPHSHDWWGASHRLRERKLSFHSIRLTAPQTVSICSLNLSLFQLDPMWMHSLMCDASTKIFVRTGCQNHTEKETWACRDTLTCTKTETHTHQMHPDRVSGPFVPSPLLQGELWWWGLIHNSSVLQQKRPCLSLRATQA